MADVKFTPGDWGWQQGKAGNADQWCLGPGVLLVDGTDGTPGGDGIDRANAHLIAASPDLYEALKALLDRYTLLVESGDAGNWDAEKEPQVTAARAALAKAEGQS